MTAYTENLQSKYPISISFCCIVVCSRTQEKLKVQVALFKLATAEKSSNYINKCLIYIEYVTELLSGIIPLPCGYLGNTVRKDVNMQNTVDLCSSYLNITK